MYTIPNLKVKFENNDYLNYTIKDSRAVDTSLVYLEIEWTAQINILKNGGVQLEVYSIDKVKSVYEILDEDLNPTAPSVDVEYDKTDDDGWKIEVDKNDTSENYVLAIDEVTINFDNRTIKVDFK